MFLLIGNKKYINSENSVFPNSLQMSPFAGKVGPVLRKKWLEAKVLEDIFGIE